MHNWLAECPVRRQPRLAERDKFSLAQVTEISR